MIEPSAVSEVASLAQSPAGLLLDLMLCGASGAGGLAKR